MASNETDVMDFIYELMPFVLDDCPSLNELTMQVGIKSSASMPAFLDGWLLRCKRRPTPLLPEQLEKLPA